MAKLFQIFTCQERNAVFYYSTRLSFLELYLIEYFRILYLSQVPIPLYILLLLDLFVTINLCLNLVIERLYFTSSNKVKELTLNIHNTFGQGTVNERTVQH